MRTLIRFLKDDKAATAVEYGLLAALISIGMLVGLQNFSDALLGVFNTVEEAVVGAGQ